MQILVMSCDKNSDLWEPFYHCMEKYYPNHPEIIYAMETKQNPYYTIYNGEYGDLYEWDWDYIDRDSGLPHMILKGDICESTFAAYGFIWGGDWANPKDYQHFEK